MLWNVVGTGALFLFQRQVFEFLGLPEPVYPAFVLLAFGYEVIFGFGYWLAYRDLYRNAEIIHIGIYAKLLFGVLVFYFFVYGTLSWIFLPIAAADLGFALLFVMAYFHAVEFVDRGPATILPVAPVGGFRRRVLVLYYSLTGQTHRAAEAIRNGLEAEGVTADLRPIEPVERIVFPFPNWLGYFILSFRLFRDEKIRIRPLKWAPSDYDLVILGSATWWDSPCLPIRAIFNDSGNKRLFEGQNVAVFAVCRGLWQGNLRGVLVNLREFGANVVDTIAFQHQGKEPFRFLTLGAYLFTGTEFTPQWLKRYLYPYGFDDAELARAEAFGRRMARLIRPA